MPAVSGVEGRPRFSLSARISGRCSSRPGSRAYVGANFGNIRGKKGFKVHGTPRDSVRKSCKSCKS